MVDVVFDRVESPMAHALASRTGKWATVHVGLDADEFAQTVEAAEGRVIVVFDVAAVDERDIVPNGTDEADEDNFDILARVEAETSAFLERCQNTVKAGSLKSDPIQVWGLSHDDIACRRLGLAETPIQNQSRLSCFKSLAKECGRMGLFFNMCIVHPEKSRLSRDDLKNLKTSMKAYALRYKPPEAEDLSAVIESMMVLDNPVMNGGALNLGNGPVEFGS